MRTLILLLVAISPAISLIMTVRYIVRQMKAQKRRDVWKPYIEILMR